MLDGGISGYVADSLGRFTYVAAFTVLLLCGVGLPLPEEVTLIGAGLLLHQEQVRFVPITVVCSAAILLGDSIPYWLGRRYGMSALRVRWVRRIVHPERFARLERRFREHGNWATFACRFFAGIRIPGYFLAGTMRMSYARFLLLDGLGVLISVPVSIWLGKIFADKINELRGHYRQLHLVFGFLLLAVLLILVLRAHARRTAERAARPPGGPRPGAGPGDLAS